MTRDHLFSAFFFVVLGLLLYQVYRVFAGFLGAAAWAAILALVFHPLYRMILARVRRPTVAAGVMTLLVYVMVVLPWFGFGSVVIGQARTFYDVVQQKVNSGEASAWMERARQTRLGKFTVGLLPPDLRDQTDLVELGLRGARASTDTLVSQLGGIARNIAGFLVDFLLMLLMLFFFFRDGDRLYQSLRDLIPMEAEHKDAIFARFTETLSAVVQGMTITAVAQGLLAGFGFWILDLPFALLLGLASAIASFVPIGGAAFVWIPATLYFFEQGLWGRALALLVWGTLVISLVDNILKPWIIGSRTRISTLFLFLGILGGIRAYGVIGVFLGPVLLATIVAFFHIYREEYAHEGPNRG